VKVKHVAWGLALGFLLQSLIQGFDRFLYVSFPVNLFGSLFLVLTLAGVGIGALAGSARPAIRPSLWAWTAGVALVAIVGVWQSTDDLAFRFFILIVGYGAGLLGAFLLGREASERAPWLDVALLVSVVALGAGMCGIRNVSVHYLLTNQYYPYPKPTHYVARTVGMGAAWIASGLLAGILGSRFARLLASTDRFHETLGGFAAGLAGGVVASYFAHQAFNPYLTMLAWGALTLLVVANRKWIVVPAGFAMLAGIGWWSQSIAPAPFVWRLADYKIQSQHWTPYYKLDFVSFNQDTCMGGVYDNLMLWYHCQDPDKLPREISTVFRVAGEGRKSALAVGRTDSMYLSLIEKWYGPLERSKSLEFDQTVVNEVTGPYSRYFNDRWKRPGHTAVAGDLQTLIRDEKEKYDIIFLNGQMIRLYLHPRTLIPQEDYLFDRDTIAGMLRLLNPHGLLVIDWGSSQEEEVYDAWSNVPDGAYASAFWTTLSNLPMSGLPLFFMFVSPDRELAEGMAARVEALGMDHDRSRAVPLDPSRLTRVDTDDRPFLQAGLSIGYAILPLPLLLVIGVIAWRLSRHARALAPDGSARLRSYFVALGALGGLLETIVVGRLSRADPAGVPMGAVLLWPIFLGGYLVPCALRLGDAPAAMRRTAAWVAALLTAAGLVAGLTLDRSLPAMAGASLAIGVGVATLFVSLAGGLEPAARAQAWGIAQLGSVLGVVTFQTLVYTLGFQWLVLALAVAAALLGHAGGRLLPERPTATGSEPTWLGPEPAAASRTPAA